MGPTVSVNIHGLEQKETHYCQRKQLTAKVDFVVSLSLTTPMHRVRCLLAVESQLIPSIHSH